MASVFEEDVRKYAAAPDGSEPDVLETSDVEEDDTQEQQTGGPTTSDQTVEGYSIDVVPIPARTAFEKFAGRTYDPAQLEAAAARARDLAAARTRRTAPAGTASKVSNPWMETPLQRLRRLQAEAAELSADLASLPASRRSDEEQGPDGGDAWSTLQRGLQSLEDRLDSMAEAAAAPLAPSAGFSASTALQAAAASSGAMPARPSADAPADEAANPTTAVQPAAGAEVAAALEARLAALERRVGAGAGDEAAAAGQKAPTAPLLQQVDLLERRVALMDPDSVSAALRRARALAADVRVVREVASAQGAEASGSRTLQATVSTIEKWDGVVDQLPPLLSRLRTLRLLHAEAALFSQRLAAAERRRDGVVRRAREVAELAEELRRSVAADAAASASNFAALEQRVGELESADV